MATGRYLPICLMLLGLLALFTLSVSAPREWEASARRHGLEPLLDRYRRQELVPPASVERPRAAQVIETKTEPGAPPVSGLPALARPRQPADVVLAQRPLSAAAKVLTSASRSRSRPESPSEVTASSDGPLLQGAIRTRTPSVQPSLALVPQAPPAVEAPTLPRVAPAPAAPPAWWPVPRELLERLTMLEQHSSAGAWAREVSRAIESLTRTAGPHDAEAQRLLAQLQELASDPRSVLHALPDGAELVSFELARHALERRLDVWSQMANAPPSASSLAFAPPPDPQRLALCIDEVARTTDVDSPDARHWQQYLLVDALREVAEQSPGSPSDEQRAIIREALARLESTALTRRQHEWVHSGALAALNDELRCWASDNVAPRELLTAIEAVESNAGASDRTRLAELCSRLNWSPKEDHQALAQHLETHYRNANFRLAVAGEFINAMVPDSESTTEPVRERILGNPTTGWSTSNSQVGVRLVPDEQKWHVVVAAEGSIHARTATRASSARLLSSANSTFRVEKTVQLNMLGVHFDDARATAENRTQLRDVETVFDPLPLIGDIAQSVALSRHEESRAAARREVQYKIARKAEERVNADVREKVARLRQFIRGRLMAPLDGMELAPEVIELETTEQRLVMRLRIAREQQLAGHAPRPQAPADSLLSLQLHDSLLNNIAQQLELEGRTFTLPELSAHLAERLHFDVLPGGDELADDVSVRFREHDAIELRADGGRIELRLAIDSLRKEGRAEWSNFVVQVFYRPDETSHDGALVRDGGILLSSQERISTVSQIPLRGVFSRIFSADRPLVLIPAALRQREQFQQLQVTQLEVREGWIGLAIGPRHQQRLPIVARGLRAALR